MAEEENKAPWSSLAPWEDPSQLDYAKASGLEVAVEAVRNLPSSAYKLGKQTVEAIMSPIQTADTITKLGAGILQEVLPEGLVQAIGEDAESRQLAQKVGQMYVQKYGSIEAFKKEFASNPAGVLSDVGMVLGLGTATIPGKAAPLRSAASIPAKVKTVGQTTSKYTDPLGATIGGIQAGGKATAGVLAATTGAGYTPIREAFEAGREGGQRAEAFRENISGRADPVQVVMDAKENLARLKADRAADYRNAMNTGVLSDPTQLSFQGIDAAIQRGIDRTTYKGAVTQERGFAAVQKAKELVDKWKAGGPEFRTVEAFDQLKQSIYAILDTIPMEAKNARGAIGDIYNAVKTDIVRQAPVYGQVMKQYEEMSDLVKQIEMTLSLRPTANIDTQLRKLQSVMRNNVNTNYGQRQKLVDIMEGQPNYLMPQLAGQAMSSPMPRGIQGATQPLGVVGLGTQNIPAAIGLAAASSPRLVGEAAYGAGLLQRIADKRPDIPLVYSPQMRQVLAEAQQIEEAQNR